MKHLGAIVLVVVLIIGAVLVRSQLSDDGSGSSSEQANRWEPGMTATIVCAAELAPVCDALSAKTPGLVVKTESVDHTENTLVGAENASEVDFDAWLVPAASPAMVADRRSRVLAQEILDTPSQVLARSPLVMVVWNDRLKVLENTCPDSEVTWKCVGELSGSQWADHGADASWGDVTPGYASPATTATGLFVIAQATGSWFGTTDYASNDFARSDYRLWLAQLEHGVLNRPNPPRTPLSEMLTKGRASFDLAGEIEAVAISEITGTRSQGDLKILYPAPSETVDVVLVTVKGSEAGERLTSLLMSDEASDAFVEADWRIDGNPVGDGPQDPLSDGDGLPSPGVLEALRGLWVEVAR